MKKIQMYYTDRQLKELRNLVKTNGISLSEQVRRVLDEYLNKKRS